jgi:hypothetical protein
MHTWRATLAYNVHAGTYLRMSPAVADAFPAVADAKPGPYRCCRCELRTELLRDAAHVVLHVRAAGTEQVEPFAGVSAVQTHA